MDHHMIGLLTGNTVKDWVVVNGNYSYGDATKRAISYFTKGGYDMNLYEVTKIDETNDRPFERYIPYEEIGNTPNQ